MDRPNTEIWDVAYNISFMYQAEYIKGGSATDPSFSSYHYDYPTQYFELVNVDCQQTKNNSQNGIIVEFSEDSEEFTTENGALVELMASLEQEPNMLAEQVIFNVFTSDASEGIVYHPTAVVFTHQNWNIPQPVVISGVYDDLDDGDQPYNISFEYSAEYTPGYSSANDPSFGRMHFKYKTQNIEPSSELGRTPCFRACTCPLKPSHVLLPVPSPCLHATLRQQLLLRKVLESCSASAWLKE